MPLAHSANPAGVTHDLADHLDCVAELAAGFAAPFGSDKWARAAGLWHDLGKNAADFQARLGAGADAHKDDDAAANPSVPGRVEHAIAGAIHAADLWGANFAHALAAAIAGHHAGMPDSAELTTRLQSPEKRARLAKANASPDKVIPAVARPAPPDHLVTNDGLSSRVEDANAEKHRRLEFWTRMLFSCLVDADWLDTEAHFEGGKSPRETRANLRGNPTTPAELLAMLDAHMATLPQTASTEVGRVRAQVLADCRERGRTSPPGVFTLTAPTGSGKTLAGMAFALEHAVAHKLKRVIVVLPFTSIIDQNAGVYRSVFGAGNVVDHHSAIDPVKESDRNRVACENWDAPVVVTTSVQFLESLLANRPAKCRKLHNICESVVVFDEVQTLPVEHLNPVLDVLKELVRAYRVSLVLSTATQPALKFRASPGLGGAFQGFTQATEVVADVPAAFRDLARVRVEWPVSPAPAGKLSEGEVEEFWRGLADEVSAHDRVLVVTHARRDCRTLSEMVSGAVHLSALMCPEHRLKVLRQIRTQLDATGLQVRVVATQLVEAGVDLDFPVVYRAYGGFDSVAQAAGRCNRNGMLEGRGGRVVVFHTPTEPPPGMPRTGKQVAQSMLASKPGLDALDPAIFEEYFVRLYRDSGSLDVKNIQSDRAARNYKTVAENFALIDPDGSVPVVVPYGESAKRLEALSLLGPSRDRLRALQPYIVSIPERDVKRLEASGVVELVTDTVYAVSSLHKHLYTDGFGLELGGRLAADPSSITLG